MLPRIGSGSVEGAQRQSPGLSEGAHPEGGGDLEGAYWRDEGAHCAALHSASPRGLASPVAAASSDSASSSASHRENFTAGVGSVSVVLYPFEVSAIPSHE